MFSITLIDISKSHQKKAAKKERHYGTFTFFLLQK